MTIQEKAIEQLERVSRHLATIGEKEDYTDIAIQALEQCEDAVSRRAVLDIVRFEENWLSDAKSNNADTDIAFSGIRTQVAKLSPVTPKKDGWISCSERLPEKNGFYLCTTKDCIAILEFTGGNPHYHEGPSFVSDPKLP